MKPLLRSPAVSRLGVTAAMKMSLLISTSRPLSTMRAVRPAPSASLATASRSIVLPRLQTPTTKSLKRGYSTAPNSHQVMESFGTPFAQFIYTISRIARIITFTALGVATIGVVSFEAAHQYVEHVAMPSSSSSNSSSSDPFGWGDLALEESWSGSAKHSGTDPRLGIKGRHAVRSAWMCVNWGGGISPGVLFGGSAAGNSGLGRTAITSMAGAKTLRVDDGMILAMQYLNLAVKIAASKGIKLPDTDAIRAGFVSEEKVREELRNVDPLALALEARLAAVKERQGSKGALESAIGSYERLYDVTSMTDGGDKKERLVRLATKLGDLHSALDKREEAEEWLNKAISIAAAAGASTLELTQQSTATPAAAVGTEGKKSLFGGWFSSSKPSTPAVIDPTPAAPPTPAPVVASTTTPTPALTRSLITALVSKSAFHAQNPTQASLQQALQTQISALQLASADSERVSSSSPTATSRLGAELHNLWLTHHQSVLDLHVAETIFALTRDGFSSKVWLNSKGGKMGGMKGSIEWLDQAELRSEEVVKALEEAGKNKGKKKGEEEKVGLGSRWMGEKEVALVAGRVLRDARRVKATAKRCRVTLEGF